MVGPGVDAEFKRLWWQLMGVKEKEEAALARSGVRAEPAGAPVCSRSLPHWFIFLILGLRLPARNHISLPMWMMRLACLLIAYLLRTSWKV